MKYRSVKGAAVGHTPEDPGHNPFLCTKESYKDFERKLRVRLKGPSATAG